jgi:hypothetical protein
MLFYFYQLRSQVGPICFGRIGVVQLYRLLFNFVLKTFLAAKYWVSDEAAASDASFDSVPDGLACRTP